MNPMHHQLNIVICSSPQDAIDRGYVYRLPEFKPIEIERVVIVRKGMESGASTVDLILENELGERYMCMLTGKLVQIVEQIARSVGDERA